jgi:chemotaxis regulatin CheY-phosphate phosphatase CheZ
MSKFHLSTEGHERSYLMGELRSLGISPIRINQLMKDSIDNNELRSLVKTTKDDLMQEFNEAHK